MQGGSEESVKRLNIEMTEAAQNLDFEEQRKFGSDIGDKGCRYTASYGDNSKARLMLYQLMRIWQYLVIIYE